jgi:hypothetical protein
MRTYLDKDSNRWVSFKPDKYWSGLTCSITGDKIFTGDSFKIMNARGHDKPVVFNCPNCVYYDTGTWIYRNYFKIIKN